jgi:hypothetical protein
MPPRIVAVDFERFMTSGRTSPALCGCEDQAGKRVGEYIVKLRGPVTASGLVNELLAARLAGYFGLLTPEPALIVIELTLAERIESAEPSQAAAIRNSVGLNFGAKYVEGSSEWPVDKPIPASLWRRAIDIFAFDALIQNPDRRYANQNLLAVKDDLLIFDHEQAFSFLLAVSASAEPWTLDDQQYLTDHVFYRRLKSKEIDLASFTASLGGLSAALVEEVVAEVPMEWKNDNVTRIERHLQAVREHADDFAAAIRRFLV